MTDHTSLSPDNAEAALEAAKQAQSAGKESTVLPKSVSLILGLLAGGMLWVTVAGNLNMVWPLLGGFIAVIYGHGRKSGVMAFDTPRDFKGFLGFLAWGVAASALVLFGMTAGPIIGVHVAGAMVGLIYAALTYAYCRRQLQKLFEGSNS